MTTLAFDTRRFVKNLTSKGMKPELADALGDEMTELMTGRLVTKDDIVDMATKSDIKDMATKTDLKLATTELWNKMLATQVVLAFIMVAAVIAANFAILQNGLP